MSGDATVGPLRRSVRRGRRVVRHARASVRASRWAWGALRRARVDLRRDGVHATVGPPPSLPARAGPAVLATLRVGRATCLERSLVLQRWLAAHGHPHDVVVGVAGTDGFAAHAWLAGWPGDDGAGEGYQELTRLPPP